MSDPKENQKKGFLRFLPPFLGVLALILFVSSLPEIGQWVGDNYYLVTHGEKRPPSKGPFKIGPYQYSRVEYPIPESGITDNMEIHSDTINRLAIHPDGGSVLFDFCPEPTSCRLLSFDLTSKQLNTVFGTNGIRASDASYSPDGKWIVFKALLYAGNVKKESFQIGLINADGSNFRTLTKYKHALLYDPSFSPDGKFVIYTKRNGFASADFYRVNVETGKSEQIMHIDTQAESPSAFSQNEAAFPSYFGSSDEIVFFMKGGGASSKTGTPATPCQDSQPDPIRNPYNARLCKANLITSVSTTLYNTEAVFKIYPSYGKLPIMFLSRVEDVRGYADYVRLMSHDGLNATLISEWFRAPEPGHVQEKIYNLNSLSPSGDKLIFMHGGGKTKERIANFYASKPRIVVRNLETRVEEEFLVPIPDEEFYIFNTYVKPKIARPLPR
jgi:WD40 repeat protein